jgi:hypothetical protein
LSNIYSCLEYFRRLDQDTTTHAASSAAAASSATLGAVAAAAASVSVTSAAAAGSAVAAVLHRVCAVRRRSLTDAAASVRCRRSAPPPPRPRPAPSTVTPNPLNNPTVYLECEPDVTSRALSASMFLNHTFRTL